MKRPSTRVAALLAAVAVLGAPLLLAGPSWAAGSTTYTKTLSRVHLVDGQDVVADSRTVKVTIGATTGLRDRQAVRISWTGAHPTNLTVSDPNTEAASQQEFPVVILQCRGKDDAALPVSQRVRPETCWTQTPAERFFQSGSLYPPWRVDRYATVADRAPYVGRPDPLPAGCKASGYQERWLHFVTVAGKDEPGGSSGCGGIAAESAAVDSKQSMPPNTTYATTDANGEGSARFNVWTSQTNASLGCSDKVACSLVVIPIDGVSCDVAALGMPEDQRPTEDDAAAVADECQAKGGSSFGAPAVTGKLWWTASNWRNRISVPLTFNPIPRECGLSGNTPSAVVYGSELLVQATQSWGGRFCSDSQLFPLRHVQVGEPQARNLLAAHLVDAAFTSQPPGAEDPTPHVMAPAALTGFAISYTVDDASGREYRNLRLTPRLLAKLLTESYPTVVAEKSENPGLKNNPLNVSLDPEFQLLNPGVKHGVDSPLSASSLYVVSSDSDVISALTSYINADPEARAWLDGAADAWGMTVNPAYKGIALPVQSWPMLDDERPPSLYNGSDACLKANPVPFLPLVAAPTTRLANVSLAVQFALAPSQLICSLPPDNDVTYAKLIALGRQDIGSRFLLGLTTLGDARRFDLDTAALQTRVTADAPRNVSTDGGRTFVGPSSAGLKAAAALLRRDDKVGTWQLPYDAFTGTMATTTGYPGTMLVSTAVPTTGLDSATAERYAQLLTYIAGPGQVPGPSFGQLPDGFVPLTSANGLGALASYTLRAATAVRAQGGSVPPLVAPAVVPSARSAPSSTSPTSRSSAVEPTTPSAPALPMTATIPASSAGPIPALAPAPPRTVQTIATSAVDVGLAAVTLPLLVSLILVSGAGAAVMTLVSRRSS